MPPIFLRLGAISESSRNRWGHKDVATTVIYTTSCIREAVASAAHLTGFDMVCTVCLNQSIHNERILQILDIKIVTRKEKKRWNFLYSKKQAVFAAIYRLHNHC
jgi:hypothetical protein